MEVLVDNLPYTLRVAQRLAPAACLSAPVLAWLRRCRKLLVMAQRWRATCRARSLWRHCKQFSRKVTVWGDMDEDFWGDWSSYTTVQLLRKVQDHADFMSYPWQDDTQAQVAFSLIRSGMAMLSDINKRARCGLVEAVLQDWRRASSLPIASILALAKGLPRPALMLLMLLGLLD